MKKRLLSWLLVLVMIFSLIPSTLVSAWAADGTSSQASGQAGKTTHTMTDELPSDLSAYDIWDVRLTKDTQPGGKITVPNGKTLIIRGTGGIAGGTRNDTIVVVEKGGHLVLDGVLIQNNVVGSDGAIYVKSGGLLDLGHNDQSERRAPSITNNKFNNAAKNLVIEDGATVRLNAAADKAIGVSYYKDGIDVGPFIAISGGRYTMRGTQKGNINGETSITSDNTAKWKLSYSYDNLIMTNARSRVLVWDATDFWSYEGTPGHRNKVYSTIQNVDSKGYDVTLIRGGKNSPRYLTAEEMANLQQYDLIVFDCPNVDITGEERTAYLNYLNNGGRILFSVENAMSKGILRDTMNTTASTIAHSLGGQFTAHAGEYVAGGTRGKTYTSPERVKELTKNMSTSWDINVGAYITSSSQKVYPLVTATTTKKNTSYVICDQDAGDRDGSQWGALTIIGDVDLFYHSYNNGVNTGGNFIKNLVENTVTRRISAAAGVNPNSEFNEWQATTTTTTTATNYRTPYAALQKAVEGNTVTLLLNSRGGSVDSVSNELLFEQSTLAYEAGSKYERSTIHADTVGVYLDITKTGEVNLYSGTVTVTPKDKNYVLTMNGTMDQDGTAITGGYKITSNTAYTLDADDEKTPILPENGGGASITIPNKGESVTVDYGNGKSVTYTAKEDNEKVYLGWYQVNKNTPSNVTWTDADEAWYGQTYTTTLTPNAGYEVNGENLTVADTDNITLNGYELTKQGDPVKDPDDETVTWTTYASTEKDRDGNPKVTVKQQHLHSGGADRNGIAIVTVNDVRADITIGAANGTVNAKAPTIYVVGIGQRTGYQNVQLWEYTTVRNTKDGVLAKPVNGWPWEKWIVTSAASGDGTESDYKKDKVTLTSDASKLDTTNETATYTINLETGDKVVVFYYSWHMVEVTIKAVDAEGNPIPDFTPQRVEYEIDEQVTITAPNLPGYTAQTPSQDYTPSETNHEITFKYNKSTGNLYYKAVYVEADGTQRDLGTFDGGVLVRGQAPNKSAQYAPKFGNYVLVTQDDGVASADKYDGINDITVTYTYKARTKDIKVYAYVGDANGQILQLDTTSYAGLTTGQTITINAPEIAGYKIKVNTPSNHTFFISNDDVAQDVEFFYEKDTSNDAYVLVKLVDSANGNKEIGSYQVPGVKDKAQLISVPAAPYGYKLDNAHAADNVEQTVTPTGADAPYTAEVTFYFVPNVHTVTIKLTDSDTSQPLNVITNYKYKYEVVDGEDLTVIAPSIYGYTMTADSESVVKLMGVTKDETVEFKYQAIDKQLVTVHVVGMGPDGKLFESSETVTYGTQTKNVTVFKIPGLKLAGATVNGKTAAMNGNTLTVDTSKADKGGTIEVVVTYEDNMASVTVQAKYNNTVMQSYTIKVEKDTTALITAPAIPGYTANAQNKNVNVDADAITVDFEYTKDAGNVTVVAVEKGTELYRKDGGTITRGDTLDFTGAAKAPDIQYYTAAAKPTSVVVNGTAVQDIDSYAYTGIGDVVVTYEYTRNLRDLVIIKKDVATNQEIPNSRETLAGLKTGESHTFLPAQGTAPTGYDVAPDRNPGSFFVEDKAGQTVTFWYKNTSADQYTQITVNLECGGKVFQTYPVTAVKNVETVITAPDVKGYTLQSTRSQNVTPTGDTAHDTVTFTYVITSPKTVKVVLKDNTDDSNLNAPVGYTESYTLKEGDSLDIWAPAIDGYTLMSATVGTTAPLNKQFVTVSYADLNDGDNNTVTFRYYPVTQANFVTHTVKFMVGANLLYSHEKMIAKGNGTPVPYSADDVRYMVPGYAYDSITYTVAGKNAATAADVTDAVNATIIYHFVEDAATITIKKVDGNDAPLTGVADTVLTGYRKGQTVQVVAPVVDGFALADTLIKDVTLGDTNEVTFKYAPAGEVTFTLKELKADSTESIIAVLNADTTKIYNATLTDGTSELDLSKYGYTYTPSDKTAAPFNVGGNGIVTDLTTAAKYVVYYTKDLRNVQYVPVNKTKLDKAGKTLDEVINSGAVDDYIINELTPAAMDKARVGETYKAVAQSFTGWALKDDFSKLYQVNVGGTELKVYFLYEQKTTGTVTVHYHFGEIVDPTDPSPNYGKLLNEYSIEAVVGEKVKVTPQEYLMDNKYHLRDGQDPVTLTVTENTETIDFYYEANYVTVTVNTVVNNGAADKHDAHEVVKGNDLTIYPPVKAGYTLVGITATGYTLTGGAADTLPDGYTNNALTLTGLNADATVTYYYKTTSATEYQTVLTVEYVYNGYKLIDDKTINVNTGETTAIDVPAFDGYKATLSTFVDDGALPVGSGIGGVTVDVTPNGKTATLTITYERTDGSIVLPGADDVFTAPNDKDNVVVKPDDGNTTLTPNPAPVAPATEPVEGSVTVPDNTTATVTRPKNPQHPENGSEDITVPGGTTINPDGTIILPEPQPNGTTINPDDKLPGNTPTGYVSVVYKANGGTGDDVIVVIKEGETITAIANPFTNGNQTFSGWNTAENGIGGTAYDKNATITVEAGSNSVTLYAQWGKSESYNHTAKITYKANDGVTSDIEDTVGANDSTTFSTTLRQNPFSVNGWTFGGWNTEADGSGTLKAAGDVIEVNEGVDQTWYAQWYKVNDDGSITVPGDGNPNTTGDNVTANGDGKSGNVTRDNTTGNVTIPAGGNVVKGNETIALPDGAVLKPDGSLTINKPNGGTIDIDKDGNTTDANVIVLTYEANDGSTKSVKVYATKNEAIKALAADTFVYSGHTFLYWQSGNDTHKAGADIIPTGDMSLIAAWAKVNPDGSIELPGKDGKLDGPNGEEKDNVIVTPDNKDGLEGPKADDGSVEVKPDHDATVTRPDPTDPNYPNGNAKEDIKVPEGTIIYPDGTIELPDGTKVTPDQPFPDVAGTYVTVTFDAGRGSGNTVKLIVAKNIDINLLDESVFVAPANHYFVGWVSGNDTYDANARYTVTGAVTFTAEYKERAELTKAVAIFDYAGGVDTAGNGSKYVTGKAGATITGIDDPNRTGYRFDGWDKTLEFGAVGSVTVFTAQWTINKYDVTFEPGTDGSLDSGDANAVYQVEHDTSVTTIPTVSANAGKVFVGWLNSLDNSVYTADSLANYKVTGDVTFTAQYVDEDKATVIFVFAGGTVNGQHSEVRTGTPGEPIGTLPEPQREGYTFNDWDAAVAATTTFKGAGSVIVYTAQWTPIQKQTFTVTFDIDATKGSTSDATAEQVEDGGFVTTVPAVTANAAYKFVAWQDQDGKLYFEAGIKLYPITKNTTFTAVFEEITVNPGTATVIFDGNGGKIGNNTVLTRVGVPGEKVDAPANPTRPGYEFLGWDGFDANTVYGAADTVTTYVAQWKAIEYTIHFSAAGATGSTAEQLYKFDGSTANTLNLNGFKLSGKQFIGWSLTEGATSADYVDGALINDTLRANLAASNTNSVTLYAVWQDAQQNTLTVTGNKTSAKPGETVDFTAFLNGAATTDVTWIVSGGKTGTSISANGVLTVGSSETNGTTLTVTAIYKLDTGLTASATVRVVVDGGNTGGGGGGTVTTSYTINASAGKGGTISPDGTVKVSRGDNKTFTIAASNGYIIADVLVDGVSVGAVSSYTFTKVSKDHTISVVFKEARPGVADPSETGVDQWLRVTDHIAYMHGYDNGNFGPMDNLTRAQAAQLFYRLLVNQDVEITVSFNDVPADAWYAKAVNTLASLSIIKGIGNGKFDPDREISRAEFIVIATRFAKTIDKVNSPFVDVADDAWYAPYVATATSYGWITGVGEGRFAPDDLVTRAEAATIVNRMLARSADREFVDGNAVQHFSDVTPDAWYYYQIMEAANGHSHRYSEDGYEVWNGLN